MAGEDTKALGKRKERDDDHEDNSSAHAGGSTLFVSNLPYTATSTDVQTLFSDIGPVRSAFVVLEGGVSKGVGYVSFAIKEDAAKTMETFEKEGISIAGRKLRVQWADRKPKEKKAKSEDVNAPPKRPSAPRSAIAKTAKDPDAIRTIVISGLPAEVDQKTLWKKVRKYDGAESVELQGDGQAHAKFTTPAAAAHAVEKLHAHVYKGSILSVTLKKRLETLAKAVDPSKASKDKVVTAPGRGSRLIVRNLPWDITEKDLRALFLPYGPIYSVHIPAVSEPADGAIPQNKAKAKPRARGFAFVWFFSKRDAERAIGGVNGRAVAAGAVIAPTMNKKERARLRKTLKAQAAAGGAGGEGESQEGGELADGKETGKAQERIVAVDWALSKDKWEQAKKEAGLESGEEEGEGEEDAASASENGVDEEASASSEASGSENEQDWVDEGPDAGSVSGIDEDDKERSDSEAPGKPTLPPPEAGTTLFVRNVPFDATEDELRTLFRAFGPLRYARITMDDATGRSRGTGFACFWNKDDADKAVRQSELLKRETAAEAPGKNPFSMPSLLTPDPSSSLAHSLVLHGRTLDVTRAVTREEAQKLKDEGERQREKADKRNIYLLREGVIFPNSPAAASIPPSELEKRNAAFNTRRALLKSNPLLYISKTRLSVRQLPTFTTDRSLKRLAIHAVRTFEAEAKKGKREPLNEEELRRDIEEQEDLPAQADSDSDADDDDASVARKSAMPKKGKKSKFAGRSTGVQQAKIVRQTDRVDVLTGKGKSKGYGFLEMTKHSDALRVLRWANNNPSIWELLEEFWRAEVEELIKAAEKPSTGAGKEKKEGKEKMVGIADDEDSRAARLKRLKDELERLRGGEGRKGRKTLVIEFSIENSQVVNRRKAQQQDRAEVTKSGVKPVKVGIKRHADEERTVPAKRAKTLPASGKGKATSSPRPLMDTGKDTDKGKLGSIISRKRWMRKTAKRGV